MLFAALRQEKLGTRKSTKERGITMKKVIIAILVMAMLVVFAGCSTGNTQQTTQADPTKEIEQQLQGTWGCYVSEKVSVEFSFNNGSFYSETEAMGVSLGEKEGTYTINDDAIVLKYNEAEGNVELRYSFANGKFTLYYDEDTEMTKG